MVKKIVKDPFFLAQKSVDATESDKQVVTDLLDTLIASLDQNFKKQHRKYSGWTAQIIQHEIDHCNGGVI